MNTNKELNLLNQKIVYDFTKFTTTDYTNELSCVVWFSSCNLRCAYCYNDNIVKSKQGEYSSNNILKFLNSRIGLLSAVVLSGGEALMYDLVPLCKEIKKMGFKIKLDTNATYPKRLKELISLNLIDFVSIDFKAPKSKYKLVTKKDSYEKTIKSIKYLIDINFPFELRTTVNTNLLSESDINEIIETIYCIGYNNIYYIQNFLQTKSNLGNITQNRDLNRDLIKKDILKIEFRNTI
ncbi:anaerobic ribonucleoside-triphosphate reductase activating protein [Aliarcobacter skirrowii]|uniref:anaerobic ribonucleoside-triphosphate reductase activating protein n=1 Tax=Aliarcobacter skirrowii TaxID=28200 RepID=UPI0029BD0DF7|nr:anaerobic ribonucleoside-triphosphate reductase activating protein [Aliarcobacter skirrowii]MDX4037761.1 anaerobic ribonucleoside-triphosphate reductase activating protein [Aliarcobacter skirrowii]